MASSSLLCGHCWCSLCSCPDPSVLLGFLLPVPGSLCSALPVLQPWWSVPYMRKSSVWTVIGCPWYSLLHLCETCQHVCACWVYFAQQTTKFLWLPCHDLCYDLTNTQVFWCCPLKGMVIDMAKCCNPNSFCYSNCTYSQKRVQNSLGPQMSYLSSVMAYILWEQSQWRNVLLSVWLCEARTVGVCWDSVRGGKLQWERYCMLSAASNGKSKTKAQTNYSHSM